MNGFRLQPEGCAVANLWIASRILPPEGGSHKGEVVVASGFSRKAMAIANLGIASRILPPEGGSHKGEVVVASGFSRKAVAVLNPLIA